MILSPVRLPVPPLQLRDFAFSIASGPFPAGLGSTELLAHKVRKFTARCGVWTPWNDLRYVLLPPLAATAVLPSARSWLWRWAGGRPAGTRSIRGHPKAEAGCGQYCS